MILRTNVPRWAEPLLAPRRYKGAKGGRSGGKSHFFAEQVVAKMAANPTFKVVGIREIQRTMDQSVKATIVSKIDAMGVSHLFDIQGRFIRHKHGPGLMTFEGMQDHNATSIKGLEDYDLAFVDEANQLSDKSIRMLYPTLRKQGSELWFAWNPENEEDAIDKFFSKNAGDPDFMCVHVNVTDNPLVSDTGWKEYLRDKARAEISPTERQIFEHVWLGGYNILSDAIVFSGKWVEREFEPDASFDGPYYGCDFGFSQDPTVFGEWYVKGEDLYCRRDCGQQKLELDEIADFAVVNMPGIEKHVIRADSAEPATISYLQRHGLPRMTGVKKWPNSVEEGVRWMRGFRNIIIHPDAPGLKREARLYRYKTNKAGDILAAIEDADNHWWDAGRYALQPLIERSGGLRVRAL